MLRKGEEQMPESRIEVLLAKLDKGQQKTNEALSRMTPAMWRQVVYAEPYPWTARDLLAHFVSAEEWFLRLLQDVTAGGAGAPEGLDYNALNAQEQKRLADQSPQALLESLTAARQATLAWARALPESELDRTGRHPALGVITLEAMLTAIYGHQLLHMRDLQHALE
jgi:hypothetical protein